MATEITPIMTNSINDITTIVWNEEELLNQVSLAVQGFDVVEASDETIKDLKTARATLKKGLAALKDFEKSVKDFILKDFNENFLPKFKNIKALVEEKHGLFDNTVKDYETSVKEKKMLDIQALYNDIFTDDLAVIAPFNKIFKEEWLQAGYKLKNKIEKGNSSSIYGILLQIKDNIEKGLQAIDNAKLKYPDVAKEAFLKHYSVTDALEANIAYERLQNSLQKQGAQEKNAELNDEDTAEYGFCIEFTCTKSKALAIKDFFNSIGVEYKNIKK